MAQKVEDVRILHMSDMCRKKLNEVRSWAIINNKHTEFLEALEYLRNFSGGSEREWKSEIRVDTPDSPDNKNFLCQVSRRVRENGREYLRPYMTIGMIWWENEQRWNFHS